MGVQIGIRWYVVIMCISYFGVVDGLSGFRNKRSFTRLNVDSNARGGRKCHDFCAMMSEMCRNGGTCVIDQNTCMGSCVCAPGWNGKWCRDPVTATSTQTPTDSLQMNPEDNDNTTETDNTKGKLTLTDSHVSNEEQKIKTEGLKTVNFNLSKSSINSLSRIPVPPHPISESAQPSIPKDSNQIKPSNTAEESIGTIPEREACIKECPDGDCIDVNGIYKCKHRVDASNSSAQRVCGPGFDCKHGVCDLEALKKNNYNCICESNYVGQFCTLQCPFDCGDRGFCEFDRSDSSYKCFCEWHYNGLNCSELVVPEKDKVNRKEEIIFHWYVVGISVVIVVLVMTSLVVTLYFMWKKRLVFMLKIVHFFQQYEEDDGKEYDAFISYKSTPEDEKFVLQHLYPKLELEFKFKLCMHFRDFLPGEAIANNIVKAIESSRRTIMILSPAYVKSEWCRMEYQKAQHEMLKLKHKIIPIVLEDISGVKSMDKNLKSILNSVTYLEWPGSDNSKTLDRFWKKLELSLPKKSSTSLSLLESQSSLESQRSLESQSSCISSSISVTKASSSIENAESQSVCHTLHLETPSPTPSSDGITPQPFSKIKKRYLKHFMGRLVKGSTFLRQDSSSSEAALVDEETAASRSSCDSFSESMLTESSESGCSTPVTAHSYLSEVGEEVKDSNINVFFTGTSSHTCMKMNERSKEVHSGLCEKDHCVGIECASCLQIERDLLETEKHSRVFLNKGFIDDNGTKCKHCNIAQNSSDDNRIRISAMDGSDKLKIQKLPCNLDRCRYCYHTFSRGEPYRGSVKQHKDAANMQLLKQNKNGSLPRNFKGSAVHAREVTLKTENIKPDKGASDCEVHISDTFSIDICENV